MAARPWRGTLIYAGAVAVIAAAGFARFAGVQPDGAIAAAGAAGADDSSSGLTAGSTPTRAAAPDTSAPDASAPDASAPEASAPDASAPDAGTDGSSSDPTATAAPDASTGDEVTIVGAAEQTRYGAVQLSVTFSGDSITDVQALQSPDRERRSMEISQQAIPMLTQEVLAAQSAQIDTISGATYTSDGYRQSLQSAIDQRG
ncbi:FMN-binding protein [Cellulomonas edaphi]|uniref:FMN-binding protein n=1 Tax=Cellulomonas edaphi TaxID=3053468 RepID=A0ABT7SAC7_9CELL|nr:FMN-binding protein [Cellulomons edaphi]MDM7832521.1 FMN-binding protein [Cellulomons edaphi]